MDQDKTKKTISFGFSKITKKQPNILKTNVENKKVELIECLEGQTIKIKDAKEVKNEPLIIPIKDSSKNLLDRVKNAKKLREKIVDNVDDRPDSELTLDELAARELLRDALKKNVSEDATKVHTLPISDDKFIAEGASESTLEDYESVPISDYGMAMLRGMGWSENVGIGKNPKSPAVAVVDPELRPKGLGLGANKIVNNISKQSLTDEDGKELQIVKGGFAKIIAGQYKEYYCEIQGFDDDTGRVIVRTTLKGLILSLNEFLIIPVTKKEFNENSKVINYAKFEEFKNNEKKHHSEVVKMEQAKLKEEYSNIKKDVKKRSKEKDYNSKIDDVKDKYKKRDSELRNRSRSPKSNKKSIKSKKKNKKDYSSDEDSYNNTKHRKKKSEKKYKKYRNESSDSGSSYYIKKEKRKNKSSHYKSVSDSDSDARYNSKNVKDKNKRKS